MKKRFLAAFLVVVMALSLTACGSSDSEKKEESPKKSSKKEYVPEDKINSVFSNPDKFEGKYIKLTGQIFYGPEKEDNISAYQAWYDTVTSSKDFIFGIEGGDTFSFEDYVIVDGEIQGGYTGENLMGGEVTCPVINAISVKKITYIEAVVPTIKEITPENAVVEQNGISMKVDKIEFAEKETRVYITESSSAADKFSMYSYDIKIIQNGQQIEQDTNSMSPYEGNYPKLSDDILPNASTSGILVFPAIDNSADFQIYAEGYSDNFELTFSPFTIDIAAQ